MDNEALNDVILDADARQFWIVLWGDPEHSPDEDSQVLDELAYDQGFAVNPAAIKKGDILFVHRINISKIIFVAELLHFLGSPGRTREGRNRGENDGSGVLRQKALRQPAVHTGSGTHSNLLTWQRNTIR